MGTSGCVPAVKRLEGDIFPDPRIKWPESGVLSDFRVDGHTADDSSPTQKSVETPPGTSHASRPESTVCESRYAQANYFQTQQL